jgi:flavin-dependent dehydrogenase
MERGAMTSPPPFDAAVIGLEPVGATAAHLLAQQGLRVAAIDRSAEVF